MDIDVVANLAAVRERIAAAAHRAGRDPGDVLLVAVTKGVDAERIPEGAPADLGENRVQELLAKQTALAGRPIRWHFVGTLQRNKARDVVGNVALIHSIDSERLAAEVASRARAAGVVQDVLLQVNVSGEATKHGSALSEVAGAAARIAEMEGVRVTGLMTMAPPGDPPAARACFVALRGVRDDLVAEHPDLRELSMGMSGDFEEAVEEGATIVRIGSAIFGPRGPG